MGQQYTVNIINRSKHTGTMCIYQTDPDRTDPRIKSLAWLAKTSTPDMTLKLKWTLDYSFIWSLSGPLKAGAMFDASTVIPADLAKANHVTFKRTRDVFEFSQPTAGKHEGSLYVQQDGNVPADMAVVGVGMSGAGTFVVPSAPNMLDVFTPHPKYWLTFGDYTPGEVMDIGKISQKAELSFPPGIYSLTATLDATNTWTVVSTLDANVAFHQARATDASARWGQVA